MSNTFFKTIEELTAIIPINAQNDIAEFSEQFKTVQTKELIPIFGKSFIQLMLTAYNDVTPPTDPDVLEVINLFQKVTGPIAVANLTYFKNVDMSTFMSERTDGDFTAAKQWRVDDLRDYLYNSGFDAIDQILEAIESSASTVFTPFKASEYYTQIKGSLIDSVQTFNTWHNINQSRRVFMLLRPNIRFIEQFQIKSQFAPIYSDLGTNEYSEIKTLLQALIVKKTIIKAIDLNILNFTDKGLRIRTRDRNVENQISKADVEAKAQMIREAQEEADFLTQTALTELNKNASDDKYKKWFDSSMYRSDKPTSYEHDASDKIYMA